MLHLSEIYAIKGNNYSFTVSKKFSVGICLDVCEPIWVKFSIIIDIIIR